MEPGWSSESNSMRAANVLMIWGRRLGVPGSGARCQGLLARAALELLLLGFGSLLPLALHEAPLLPTEPAVRQGNLAGGKRHSRQIPQDTRWLHPDRCRGCGVVNCPLGLVTAPSSPSSESRPLVLFAWHRVISACQEPGWSRI